MQDSAKPAPPRKRLFAGVARVFSQENSGTVYVLAFFLPFFIFALILALRGVYPFGDRQILNYDGWHQYFPFLQKLWDHFHRGQSLLYDRSMGLGTNFLSMLSYYGASPLNLLLMLSPTRDFRVAFTLLCAVKIGLAGLFTARLLKELFPGKAGLVPAFFGLGYALSGYLMGYYWNTMWLDNIALFPLLCWCLVRLLRRGKAGLYVLVLGLSLFTNYYIGYMACLFLILAFLALCFIDRVGWSGFWRRLCRFALTSLLGGALAAVMLLPAFFGLLNTASTAGSVSRTLQFNESLRDLLAPLIDFVPPTVMEGLPNLFCGALIALFAFAFLWAKKVGFREKLCAFLITVFLLLSMNANLLNYVWHGFHFTNMIPYRFAFLFTLTLVVTGYGYFQRGVAHLDGVDALGMFLFIGLLLYCAWGLYQVRSILLTLGILTAGVILGVLYAVRILPRQAFAGAVCLAILCETAAGAVLGVDAVGTTSYSAYYGADGVGEEVRAVVDQVKAWEADSADFYRMEATEWYSLNDSCLYDYNGVSQFASSANARASGFLQDLGLPADRGSNRFVYVHSTPLVNTLLGIKYLYHKGQPLTDRELVSLNTPVPGGKISLYENTGFAGLGFGAESSAADFTFDPALAPWENQNALFRALTGLEGDLLIPLSAQMEETDTLSVTPEEKGAWSFVKTGGEEEAVLRIRVSCDREGSVFVYANVPGANYAQMNNIWHALDDFPSFFSAGSFRKGEEFTLRAIIHDLAEGDSGFATLQAYALDSTLWQEGLARLKREPMEITSFTETEMEAEITLEKDGYLYTSMPAERAGWTLLVDGREAEITPFAGALVGARLPVGSHTLVFRYTPQGFVPGAVISGVALAVFFALVWAEKRGFVLFREKPRPAPAPSPSAEEKERFDL
ncbi:MAG: YfhO family protein [Clostridia bacterium]|nr:YfhO family protein [Clostridia bacterium]